MIDCLDFPGLKDLKFKKKWLSREIRREEGNKKKLEGDIQSLKEKLNKVECNMNMMIGTKGEVDTIMEETECAYSKVRNKGY